MPRWDGDGEATVRQFRGDVLPLEDYFQTRHGLILPEELAGTVVQDGV